MRNGVILVLILNISSELTWTTSLCITFMIMFGFSLALYALMSSEKIPFILGAIILISAILVIVFGPHEDHIFVDGRTVDWEAIARQEYRTVNIEGTVVELIRKEEL